MPANGGHRVSFDVNNAMINKSLFLSILLLVLSSSVVAIELDKLAADFSLPSINTTQILSLDDYKGKVIYLDFWASWCAPCRVSFPILDKLYQTYEKDGFVVIAINLDDELSTAQKFLIDYPVNFTVLWDASTETPEIYQVEAMPTSFIIDRDGRIRYIHPGFSRADEAELTEKIITLLAK